MIKQEFHPDGSARHRLIDTITGQATEWAPYTCIVMLKSKIGYTSYYGAQEGITSPEEFCRLIAYGVED